MRIIFLANMLFHGQYATEKQQLQLFNSFWDNQIFIRRAADVEYLDIES